MTITSTQNSVSYTGNGATTVWAYPFLIPAANEVVVTLLDLTTGSSSTIGANSYTITGIGAAGGGSLTYPIGGGSPIDTTKRITIERVLPLVQNTSLTNQSAFYPDVLENALDYLTMLVQQSSAGSSYALRAPVSDAAAPLPIPAATLRANQLLGFDGSGNPIAAQPSSAPVSSAMAAVVAAATIAIAQSALGQGSIGYYLGSVAGTTNAITATVQNITTSFNLVAGSFYWITLTGANTGATTLSVNGGSAIAVKKISSGALAALSGNELHAVPSLLYYDGTQFVILASSGGGLGPLTSVASASTVDLGAAASFNISLTGSTTITSFGTTAPVGSLYYFTSAGAIQITYNATSMITPTQANLTMAAGGYGVAQALGSGNWQILSYVPPKGVVGILGGTYRGLKINVTAGTTLVVTADSASVDDGNGLGQRLAAVNATISTATSGALGLDTGAITTNSWYAVWIIAKPDGTASAMLSLSATAPTMPSGYTFKARYGWVRTDGSSQLKSTIQYGNKAQYKIYVNITSGTSGNISTPTWTAIAIGGFVPSTASEIILSPTMLGTSSNAGLIVAPNNSYSGFTSTTNTPPIIRYSITSGGTTLPQYFSDTESITLESTNIYYASLAADGYLNCRGWVDNL